MRSGYFENGAQVGEWTTYDRSGKVVKVTMMKVKKGKGKCDAARRGRATPSLPGRVSRNHAAGARAVRRPQTRLTR
jgi:hypothetical protein